MFSGVLIIYFRFKIQVKICSLPNYSQIRAQLQQKDDVQGKFGNTLAQALLVANNNRAKISQISQQITQSKSELDSNIKTLGSLQRDIASMQSKGIFSKVMFM